MIGTFFSLLLATSSPSKPSLLNTLEQQKPTQVATRKFCSKQTAKVYYKGELFKMLPLPEPVCNNDRRVIEALLKANQIGYLSLPDEKNCAPTVIVVQSTPETQFFVTGIPLCLTKGASDTFKNEFMFYMFDIDSGEIYESPQ
jgi:hypothetical protein